MEASDQLHTLATSALWYLLNGRWGGKGVEVWWPRAGLEVLEKRKVLGPARIQSPDCPACSLVTIPSELSHFLCYTVHLNVTVEAKWECNSLTVGSVKAYLHIFVKAS